MSEFYYLDFPNGLNNFKQRQLNLEVIKEQCEPKEVLRIESGTKQYHIQKAGLFGNTRPFLDDKGQPPPPGRYKVIVKESLDDIFEYGLCGSTSQLLTSPVEEAKRLSSQYFSPNQKYYIRSSESAVFRYSFHVMFKRLIVTVDYVNHINRLMQVKAAIDIFQVDGRSLKLIAGQVHTEANLIPYELILRLAAHYKVKSIVFTGMNWSGTISHAAAIILRNSLSNQNNAMTVKAISFGGPLCVSPSLNEFVNGQGYRDFHTTINSGYNILDRLLIDYQRMSPLESFDVDSWKSIYTIVNKSLNNYFEPHRAIYAMDIEALRQKESNLKHHSAITGEYQLAVVGRYVVCIDSGNSNIISEPGESMVGTFDNIRVSLESLPCYTWYDVRYKIPPEAIDEAKSKIELFDISPKISKLKIIKTEDKFTFTMIGENLDSLLMRDVNSSEYAKLSDNSPIKFGAMSPDLNSIKYVQSEWTNAVIELSRIEVPTNGSITLRTDFGESLEFPFTDANISGGKTVAPSKWLHPTMNAEFLSSALLRVAIFKRKDVINPDLDRLWNHLLTLEALTCANETNKLSKAMTQFLCKEIDISTFRNMAMDKLEIVARVATEDYVQSENIVVKVARKAVGGIGFLTGSILSIVGVILIIPASIGLPLMYLASRNGPPTTTLGTIGFATGALTSGILTLPGLIVTTVGGFVAQAGAYAMRDYQSVQYKQILRKILELLNGNIGDIFDEMTALEDKVVEIFSTEFPNCKLSEISLDDLNKLLNEEKENKDIAANFLIPLNELYKKKLLLIGRIHAIREYLENNQLIGFIGIHNAGKSTTIEKLFDVDTDADLVRRTEEPIPYQIGGWIDTLQQQVPEFQTWFQRHNYKKLKVFAVDFPGTTDERVTIGHITEFTAELASAFVVVLRAGHVALPERQVLNVAKANYKPYIVVINQCDTIKHELEKPANADRIRANYAKVLDIPEANIHFSSAIDPMSINRLRSLLFGLLHNVISDPATTKALPLFFIKDSVANRLLQSSDVRIIDHFDELSEAASSLLLRHGEIDDKNIQQGMAYLIDRKTRARALTKIEKSKSNEPKSKGSFFKKVTEMAVKLGVRNEAYTSLIETLSMLIELVEKKDRAEDFSDYLEVVLGALLIQQLSSKLKTYFGREVDSSNDFNMEKGIPDVLLAIDSVFTVWIDRGYSPEIVRTMINHALIGDIDFTEASLLHYAEILLESHENRASSTANATDTPETNTEGIRLNLRSFPKESLTHIESYLRDKANLHAVHSWSFATYNRQIRQQGSSTIELFLSKLKSIETTKYEAVTLQVNPQNGLNVIETMMSIDNTKSRQQKFLFQLAGEVAIDFDGVTRSILTSVAKSINSDPKQFHLAKDEETGFIYFDPHACFVSDSSMRETTATVYRGLGRLMGLTIRYHLKQVSFPVNFPVAVYKWILGYRLTANDLITYNPQIINSLNAICLMDEDALQSSGLSMSVPLNNNSQYEFAPDGQNIAIDFGNRNEYLKSMLEFYLCWMSDPIHSPVNKFVLGIQDICDRDLFDTLPPSLLQVIVEGATTIDLIDWKANTEINNNVSGTESVIQNFWEIVSELSDANQSKLLCFTTGSSRLPVGGFSQLNPKFKLVLGPKTTSLPVAHTCFNMLVLPQYESKEMMREKLLKAIEETEAAHLTLV